MKNILRKIVDTLPTAIVYHIHHFYHRLTLPNQRGLETEFFHKLPDPPVVVAGPFKGLRFLRAAFSSAVPQCLLGTYELEIHSAVDKLCSLQSDCIINIGAGEGYYTVGMARRNPQARSIGFEMFKPARHLLRRIARANGVADRVQARGICTPRRLTRSLQGTKSPVVICDCEGAEDSLLDPVVVPTLNIATILVELHDHMCAGVSTRIRQRFHHSHNLAQFDTRGRSAADLPPGYVLTPQEIECHIVEHRGVPQTWFLLTPKR